MSRKLLVVGALLVLMVGAIQPALAKAGVVHVVFSEMNKEKYTFADAERIEAQLKTGGFQVDRIGDAGVASLEDVSTDDVIVLCAVYLVSEDMVKGLARFAEDGGGILWIDAPTPTIPTSAALRSLLGCSVFTVNWTANFGSIGTGRPILYKHFINGNYDFFTAYHCSGNSAWAPSSAYEFGRFPPMQNKEWDVVSRSPVKGPGIVDRIPVWTLNMVGNGRVVLFNWKAQHFGGYAAMDMIRRATAWLLTDGDEAAATAILAGRHGNPNTTPSELLPYIEAVGDPNEEPLGNPRDFKLQMGIFVRPQNYGQTGRGQEAPPEPIREWPKFKKMVNNIKMIGSNRVTLSTGPGSLVGERDLLQEFIEAMHAEGLKVDSYSGDFGPRGPNPQAVVGAGVVGSSDRPGRESSRGLAPLNRDTGRRGRETTGTQRRELTRQPPSSAQLQQTTNSLLANQPSFQSEASRRVVGCLWDFAPKWADFIDKLTDRDLDGLCVPPDEYSRRIYNGDPSDDSECIRRFKKEYGFDMPVEMNDNPESRAWMNYEYKSLAEVYSQWNNLVAKKKPNVQRTNIIFVGELCWNWKAPINWGLIGHASDWSAFMTDPYVGLHMDLTDHWYVPETVKRLMSSTRDRQALVTLQNNRLREFNEQLRPQHVYGEAVSSIAHGGKGVHFFHYFKIFDDNGDPFYGRIERTIQANSLMRTLDKWGAVDGQVPQQIVLLFSQMSQDYVWLVRHKYLGNGYDAHQAAIDMLLANGYPFEIYQLDIEDAWAKLPKSTKVIIIPFAYAISDKSVDQLEAYAKSGRKIILMQRMGEADMKGELRSTPALDELLAKYPEAVVRIDGDLTMGRVTPDFEANYCKTIDAALGDAKLVNLDRCGQDIEATVLNLKDGKCILFALNWERKPAQFELGVNLPAGKYRLTERNLKGTQPAKINGSDVIDSRDLKRFAVNLMTEELKFWLIEPVS